MISTAYAAGESAASGGIAGFLPIIGLFAIFYFLLIRPQQKKAKEHRDMVANLQKGMRVITSGGIHGTITATDDDTVGVEIAEKIKIKVARGNIAIVVSKNETTDKIDKK
ncbi:MAG: preprotein translocase subunit YajC [Pseudomonadota bacterium]